MEADQIRSLYRHLSDIHVTCDLLRSIVAMKGRGTITKEVAMGFFDRFRADMDDGEAAIVDHYCDSVGEWVFDTESEAKAEAAYNEIGLRVRLARAQLLQRGDDWRPAEKEVPTTDALF